MIDIAIVVCTNDKCRSSFGRFFKNTMIFLRSVCAVRPFCICAVVIEFAFVATVGVLLIFLQLPISTRADER